MWLGSGWRGARGGDWRGRFADGERRGAAGPPGAWRWACSSGSRGGRPRGARRRGAWGAGAAGGVPLGVLVGVGGGGAASRTAAWADEARLWDDVLAKYPD